MNMKLLMIVLRDSDDEDVIQELIRNGYGVTRMASTGGFLRRGNMTLMVGVEAGQVEDVMKVLREACPTQEGEQQHRATVFVVNMPYFEKV